MKYPHAVSFPRLILRQWKMRRTLRRKLEESHNRYQSVLNDSHRTHQTLLLAVSDLQGCTQALEQFESRRVIQKAEELAVEVPDKKEKPTWWTDDSEDGTPPVSHWLTERGRLGVLRLVSEERRKTWEWRIRILTPILTILVGLLGLLVALVSLLLKIAGPTTLR